MCSMCVFSCVSTHTHTHTLPHAAICISPEAASTSNNLRAHERWCIMPPHTRIMGRIIDGAEEVDGINASCARVCARASVRMYICSSGAITQVSVCVCLCVRALGAAFGSVCQKCVRLHEVSLVRAWGTATRRDATRRCGPRGPPALVHARTHARTTAGRLK